MCIRDRVTTGGYFGTGGNSNSNSNLSVNNSNSSGVGFLRNRSNNNNNMENCYLGKVDHFYGLSITAYLTYGGMKFVMIHGTTGDLGGSAGGNISGDDVGGNASKSAVQIDDNALKLFYQEVHELYIKTLMNPFYRLNDPITTPAFDKRVRALARKHIVTSK